MRKSCLVLCVLVMLLIGCGSGGGAAEPVVPLPTLAGINDSPRAEETPEPGLPPTWTPVPTIAEGHVFDQRGGSGSGSSGSGTPVEGTRFIYVVKAGDTLAKIAIAYGVTVSDLATLNKIADVDRIEVGQQLIIPVTGNEP